MGQGSSVSVNCGVGHRRGSDPMLLWLWCRQAAIAPIRLLAWELPYATGVAIKRPKKNYVSSKLRGIGLFYGSIYQADKRKLHMYIFSFLSPTLLRQTFQITLCKFKEDNMI